MTGSDTYIYDEAINPPVDSKFFTKKNIKYLNDTSGGTYNSQFVFDTSSLSNSGEWIDYSQGIIEIPYTMSLQSSVDISGSGLTNAFQMGLKNGYYQIIDSIQVDFNNSNVQQLTPFTNFYVNYKVLSTWSQDTLNKDSSTYGVYPDSAGSYTYTKAPNANGEGLANVEDFPTSYLTATNITGTWSRPENYNSGFLERKRRTTAYGGSGNTTTNTYGGLPMMLGTVTTQTNPIGKNIFQGTGSGASKIYTWSILATIKLSDISGFCEALPITKGAFMRLTINYNSCHGTSLAVANLIAAGTVQGVAPTQGTFSLASYVTDSGRTNPMLLTSFQISQALSTSTAQTSYLAATVLGTCSSGGSNGVGITTAGTLTYACGIKTNFLAPTSIQNAISQCRLYVPAYTMSPVFEAQFLNTHPTRTIEYNDIYNYNIIGITTAGSINSILTNGLANLKQLLVIPRANNSATTNGTGLTTLTINPEQSVVDTFPGTTCPLASISHFQVLIAGTNIFQQNVDYDFDAFLNETVKGNAVNGNDTEQVNSGLISQYMFDNAYRYYVVNLSRRLASDNQTPKSVSLQGTNNTLVTLDYMCFLVFGKSITINTATSQIVNTSA